MTTIAIQQAVEFVSKREAARTKRREDAVRRRERAKAATAEFERLAKIRAEEIAEDQAPSIQRVAVVGFTAEMLHAAKTSTPPLCGPVAPIVLREPVAEPDPKRGGFRRVYPLVRVHGVTVRHLAAVTRLSQDYEIGVCGATSSGDVGVFVSGNAGVGPSDRQLVSAKRYREACDAMGAHRSYVQWMGLHRWSLTQCMKVAGVGHARALERLLGGLEALEAFYLGRHTEPSTCAAEPIPDADITDIPQDQIGRVRAPGGVLTAVL